MATAGFLPFANPISDWVAPRRNQLMGFSSGMLAGDPSAAMVNAMKGGQVDADIAEKDRLREEETAQGNATRAWLEQQGYSDLVPLVDAGQGGLAYTEALRRMQPGYGQDAQTANMRDYLFSQENPGFADFIRGGTNRQNVSLTPQWGQDEQGNWVMLQPSSTGELVQSQVPDGVRLVDPRQINLEKAQGTAVGTAAGQAQAAAPGDIAAGEMALNLINQIRTSPELPWATGTSVGFGGNKIPGTGRYGFQNLVDQAKSGAFLSAIQQMRGLGALSNTEGQAATQAITRMDTALSQQDFLKALSDYEQIVARGVERARARQGGGQPNSQGGQSASDPLGIR
ncbi:hypothetical protein [Paradevosia shaoguanensis]|uniref:hypothetical protein n=1 Tax=Paradevosia shaoguanensis TaxID=1335043 RepID=UPI00193301DD|nr:hypothetical protein [Paradevosia shaoguanensis]